MRPAPPPQSAVIEAGTPLYVNVLTGEEHLGGGYLGPGEWHLLASYPLAITLIANSQSPGPKYETWDQKISFPSPFKIYWFLRYYIVTATKVAAYCDSGGGPKPLYNTYYVIAYLNRNTSQQFYEEWSLKYYSTADVNQDGEINGTDLTMVSRRQGERGGPANVVSNGWVEEEDMDLVARLFGAKPDQTMQRIMKQGIEEFISNPYSFTLAPRRTPFTWGKLKGRD